MSHSKDNSLGGNMVGECSDAEGWEKLTTIREQKNVVVYTNMNFSPTPSTYWKSSLAVATISKLSASNLHFLVWLPS